MDRITARQYIKDVTSGKVTTCNWVKLAVKRHLDDLERSKDPSFPYYFDEKSAIRKITFSQDQRHIKGEWAKQRLKLTLEPWQQFIDWCLFGWKRKTTHTRRFTKAYIEVARKNGKTLMAATTANFCLFADGEEGAEVYFCATKRDQAKIAWSDAHAQIQKNPILKNKTSTFKMSSTVTLAGTSSFMRPVGQDSDTEDGLNPHFVLVDEYHAHRSSDLINVMEDGMGSRTQPLLYIITTAGYDKNSPCHTEERTMITGMLDGTLDPKPEHVFGVIYSLDEGDDWTDQKVWVKANPNLGVSVYPEFLKSQISQALASPQKQNSVLTKNFNIWTQAVSRWIGAETWDACIGTMPDLRGRKCFAALDLSTNIDITAWVLCFPPQDMEKQYNFLYRFFIPEENLREREQRDKVPYSLWIDQGWVSATPGNVIDYDFIEAQILEDAEVYDIQEAAYDPWNSTSIINNLNEEEISMVPFRQGFASMSPASKEFEKKVLAKELNHGNNPVIKWMVSCTELKTDPAGNIKPVKPDRQKSGKRIDGVVASIMALDRACQVEPATSAYDERGVLSI